MVSLYFEVLFKRRKREKGVGCRGVYALPTIWYIQEEGFGGKVRPDPLHLQSYVTPYTVELLQFKAAGGLSFSPSAGAGKN